MGVEFMSKECSGYVPYTVRICKRMWYAQHVCSCSTLEERVTSRSHTFIAQYQSVWSLKDGPSFIEQCVPFGPQSATATSHESDKIHVRSHTKHEDPAKTA